MSSTNETCVPLVRLRRPWRWVVLGALTMAAILPVLQAGQALRAHWQPVGDNALIGIRARDVLVDPPLVGQPNSADAQGVATDSAHLGPIETYLLAAPVAICGPRVGLALGAALLNSFALVTALVLALRRGGMVLFALLVAALPVMVFTLGGGILHDPINSDIATVALVPLVLAAWSSWEGDLAVAPVLAFLAALVLQPHLANAPFAAPAVLIGVIGLIRTQWREGVTVRRTPALAGALALTVVLWLPIVLAELSPDDRNLDAVWSSIFAPTNTMGWAFGLQRLAWVVGPIPFFLHPNREVLPVGYPGAATIVVGLLLAGLATASVSVLAGTRRRSQAHLLGVVSVLLFVTTVASTRLPFSAVVRPEHGRWMWVGGLLFWVAIAWAGWSTLPAPKRRAWSQAAVTVLVLVGAVATGAVLRGPALEPNSGRWLMPRLEEFTEDIKSELPTGRYELVPGDAPALLTVVPAVALVLDESGYRTFVLEGTFSRGYDDRHFLGDQAVDGTLVIYGAEPSAPPPGSRRVALSNPPPGATDDAAGRMIAYLVPA